MLNEEGFMAIRTAEIKICARIWCKIWFPIRENVSSSLCNVCVSMWVFRGYAMWCLRAYMMSSSQCNVCEPMLCMRACMMYVSLCDHVFEPMRCLRAYVMYSNLCDVFEPRWCLRAFVMSSSQCNSFEPTWIAQMLWSTCTTAKSRPGSFARVDLLVHHLYMLDVLG